MSDTIKPEKRFRPNPKRQIILVVLALVGLGVGYGLGFVFKRPPNPPEPKPPSATSQPSQPAPPVTAAKSAIPAETAPMTPKAEAPAAPPPVLPEHGSAPPANGARAYEEALPKEIVVIMEPLAPAAPATTPLPEPAPIVAQPSPPAPAAQPETGTKTEIASVPAPDTAADETTTAAQQPAWRRYAVTTTTDGRPRIAIVMDDLGIDRARTRRTLNLPGPLSLSFLAYAHDLQQQADAGRGRGHEIWLHVPMEPSSASIDPGPHVLLTGKPAIERATSLNWNLDRLDGFVGINNHMGSRFTADADGMHDVMAELKKRGLAFLDSVTSAKSVGHKAARDAGVPFTLRNVFLDHEDDLKAINSQLRKLENLARKQGHAIAIGHPRESTLAALKPWLEELPAMGFQLVPASSLLRQPAEQLAKTPEEKPGVSR